MGNHWGAVDIHYMYLPEAFQEDNPKWHLGGLSDLEGVQEDTEVPSKCGQSGRG